MAHNHTLATARWVRFPPPLPFRFCMFPRWPSVHSSACSFHRDVVANLLRRSRVGITFFGFHYLLDCSSAEPRRNGCGDLLTWWSVGGFFDFIFGQWCSKTKNRPVLVFPLRFQLGSPAHLAGATARLISGKRSNLKSAFESPSPLSTARNFWYNMCMKEDLWKNKESKMKECCHCEQCGQPISSEDYEIYGCVCSSCAIENL